MMGRSGLKSKHCGLRLRGNILVGLVVIASLVVAAESGLNQEDSTHNKTPTHNATQNAVQPHHGNKGHSDYKQIWPKMKFGWKIVVGAIIGFLGAAFGTAGGVGGGGIFVPMLTLIIGFDAKSSIAISKCMITGAAAATVYYNLNQRHPTLEMPVIDYDLALLFQPMLVLGVSIGVTFNVIFPNWMITILLIIIFLFISTKALLKGIETWKKETITKKEAIRCLESNGDNGEVVVPKPPPGSLSNGTRTETKVPKKTKVSVVENVHWKALGLLFAVWSMILALQIAKDPKRDDYVIWKWDYALNFIDFQIPVAASVTTYQAFCLYKGRQKIASKGEAGNNWSVVKLIIYCFIGLVAGVVSSATATFAMTFSASMSVVEYYLLKRFPVPYALYLFAVTTIAGFVGQHVVKKVIDMLGRASIIIFILSFTVLVSAISLGSWVQLHKSSYARTWKGTVKIRIHYGTINFMGTEWDWLVCMGRGHAHDPPM
ncbi:hypothetical protein GH714_035328 [Hevea brasiliensis]|uniref:Sulfite exporter TauE/SafE family protein n=1 Tax=Hevea brasiliensis TaxID=3981 RepID=A0A6A6NCX8_HEVBR|nr:hypothetical protein GH714_035328 [Hevea brasiliensis]